jgi:hypothetical protein
VSWSSAVERPAERDIRHVPGKRQAVLLLAHRGSRDSDDCRTEVNLPGGRAAAAADALRPGRRTELEPSQQRAIGVRRARNRRPVPDLRELPRDWPPRAHTSRCLRWSHRRWFCLHKREERASKSKAEPDPLTPGAARRKTSVCYGMVIPGKVLPPGRNRSSTDDAKYESS